MKKKSSKGGDESLRKSSESGPIDTFNHKFRSKQYIQKHKQEMQNELEMINQHLDEEYKKRTEEMQKLEALRIQKIENQRITDAENFTRQQTVNAEDKQQTEKAVGYFGNIVFFTWVNFISEIAKALWAVIKKIVKALWTVIVALVIVLWKLLKGILYVIKEMCRAVWEVIKKILGTICKDWLVIPVGVIILIIIFIIFILLVLGIFDIGPFSRNNQQSGGESSGYSAGDCNLPSTVNINIHNFGKFYSTDKIIGYLETKLDNIVLPKIDYSKIPSFDKSFKDFISNPFDYLSSCGTYAYQSVLNIDAVQNLLNGTRYSYNFTLSNLNLSDPDTTQTLDRKDEINGRCDNILNVDVKMFGDKSILKDRNINMANSVVMIGRPKDVEWEMSDNDFFNSDYNKLPPSLQNKKNQNNIALSDKKTIIIPWISKDNYYTLSCDEAYFKNNPNEKAKVLIDKDDNSCTFDLESEPKTYDTNKKRYKITNDLSSFL